MNVIELGLHIPGIGINGFTECDSDVPPLVEVDEC
jgi:hypothetical protein